MDCGKSGWCVRTSMARAAAALALLGLSSGMVVAEPLVLQGSTTFNTELLVTHHAEIEAASHHGLSIVPNKSNVGLLALLEGKADLAMISTTLGNELPGIARAHPGLPLDRLRVFSVAKTSAALILHPSNPLKFISRDDLRRVLSGQIKDWHDLGGPSLPIRIVAARAGGGVVSTVEASVLGKGEHIAAPNQIRVQNGPQIVKVVEQEPGALGITNPRLAAGRAVRTLATAAPIEQELSLVSLGEPTAAAREVIDACRQAASR